MCDRSPLCMVWFGAVRLQHFTQLFHVYTLEGHGYILVWSKRSVYIKPFEGLDHLFSHRGTNRKYCARRAQIPTPSVCCFSRFCLSLYRFYFAFRSRILFDFFPEKFDFFQRSSYQYPFFYQFIHDFFNWSCFGGLSYQSWKLRTIYQNQFHE